MKIEKPSHTGLLFGAEKKYFINKKYLPRAIKIEQWISLPIRAINIFTNKSYEYIYQ